MRSAVAVCRVLFDTIALGPEAERQRQVGFGVGRDSVLAIVESDSIWRLEVVTPHLRTTDGLGVGSPLRDLILPDATGVEADGGLYILLRKRCGLSFQMSYTPEGPEHRQDWSVAELQRLPDTTRVIRALVVGCNR
jgi:hypothetical protein